MKDLYLKMFSGFPFPILLLEPVNGNWIIRDVNIKYCEVTKKKPEELVDQDLKIIFPENFGEENENWEIVQESIEKVWVTGETQKISLLRYDIYQPETGNFQERWWSAENQPVLDEKKQVKFIVHIAIDRTAEVLEQKIKEEFKEELELKEQEHKFLIEANPDGLYSLDTKGNFTSVNNGLSRIMEKPREELLNMNIRECCPAHEVERVLLFFQEVLKGKKQSFEVEFISEAGEKKILKISLMPISMDDATKGAYGIVKEVTAMKITQEALVQKEFELVKNKNKYGALVQEAFDLVGILDLEANFLFVSDSSTTVLGIPPEDFLGKNAFDFIHLEDKERVLEDFSKIEVQKKIKVAPFRFKDDSGTWRWFETNVSNMINDPCVEGIVINSREVTDLIAKNCELQQLHERYELAAAATGDLIYDWDLETDAVKRFFTGKEKQFGYDKNEIDQRHFWKEHVHPEELEGLRKVLRNTLKDPKRNQIRTQYRLKRADGTYAHLIDRGMIVRDENGKALRMIGATSDISGLVNRRNALRIANKRFTYAMKATREMIWDWDFVNNTIERSKSFEKIIGTQKVGQTSPDESWFEKINKNDQSRVKESLNKALKDPSITTWREEYKVSQLDGKNAYVIDRAYIIRDSKGEVMRMVGATLDVSESRRMLKAIRKQNKLLKEVAWEQAHVVRAPIARLKGLLNLIDEDNNGDWEKEEILQLIKDSADELDRIVINIIRKTEGIEIDG